MPSTDDYFVVEDTFDITGRGLVIVGRVGDDSIIKTGDVIMRRADPEGSLAKIVGVEMTCTPGFPVNHDKPIGLLTSNYGSCPMPTFEKGQVWNVWYPSIDYKPIMFMCPHCAQILVPGDLADHSKVHYE